MTEEAGGGPSGIVLRPDYPVVTDRLLLRPLTEADLDDLVAYRGRADVARYVPFEPQSRDDVAAKLMRDPGDGVEKEDDALRLGVVLDGRVIGDLILFFRSERDRHAEVGWVFHPDVAGRGYATEAAAALLRLAVGAGFRRVTAKVDGRNDASARVCRRLGMRLEAHFVESELFKGEWGDLLVFAVLDRELRA